MQRNTARLGACLLALLPLVAGVGQRPARADIAPSPTAVSLVPMPRLYQRSPDGQVQLVGELSPAGSVRPADIRLAEAVVDLHVWPTLVLVRVEMLLVGGATGAARVPMGFLLASERVRTFPSELLSVSVRGQPATVSNDIVVTRTQRRQTLQWSSELWRSWTISVGPGERVPVRFAHVQPLYRAFDRGSEGCDGVAPAAVGQPSECWAYRVGAVLPWLEAFGGGVDRFEVRLHPHGVDPGLLELPEGSAGGAVPTWRLAGAELAKRRGVWLEMALPEAAMRAVRNLSEAPWELEELPARFRLVDRLIRFSRRTWDELKAGGPSADEWIALVEDLLAAADAEDDELSAFARLVLDQLRQRSLGALVRHPKCCDGPPPAPRPEVARLAAWLTPDGAPAPPPERYSVRKDEGAWALDRQAVEDALQRSRDDSSTGLLERLTLSTPASAGSTVPRGLSAFRFPNPFDSREYGLHRLLEASEVRSERRALAFVELTGWASVLVLCLALLALYRRRRLTSASTGR